jgi:type II secretory pathway pseudopilin PulG
MNTTHRSLPSRGHAAGFTLVEALISMAVVSSVLAMCMSTFMMGMRTMYRDSQRLATNGSLRSFMAQISKETLDASYFYVFDYYTKLDGSVNLSSDPAILEQDEDYSDDSYDKWVAHGDCLVLVTMTSVPDTPKVRQVRIYYRRTKTQAQRNVDAPLRYYETQDWGVNGTDTSLAAILNGINLNANTTAANYDNTGMKYNPLATDFAGSKLLTLRTRGRKMSAPTSPYVAGDLYPIFSSESGSPSATNGFVSINVEFLNGTNVTHMLSSSSFNYTISPRR